MPSTFVVLGSVTAVPGQPARVQIVDLDTGTLVYDQELEAPADRDASIDFEPVLTLEPGRYRATVSRRCGRDLTGAGAGATNAYDGSGGDGRGRDRGVEPTAGTWKAWGLSSGTEINVETSTP